ncbi:hypothetical protein M9H77_33201 [Catharanthus roseus]|uniref:Uncharacterized protein n=1 Tax=Catharanthus roseus TaxID=4058 RepID=A0ACB9ZHY3_CATRO|nr:hypothetical protein M9H77_33201 [Catharanthus roseus]
MPDDHLAFLINKFIDDFQAEKTCKNFPLENEFKSIKILLEEKNMLNSSLDVKKLRPRLAELNDLLAECVAMAEKGRKKSFKEIWHRVKINRKLKEIKKTLEECKEIFEKEECEVFSSSILVLKPQAFHYFDQSKIYGFENQIEKIENDLLRSKLGQNKTKRAIKGIVGMGGSGKTALARSIFHSENMKNHFELRLWIDFSEAIDEKKKYFCILVEKFGSGYIKSPCQYGLDEVLCTLYGYIGNKQCLIVLDGLWHGNEAIKEFIFQISREGVNGAVIFTSRFLDLAMFLVGNDEECLHRIQHLDGNLCLSIVYDSLLKKQGYLTDVLPQDLVPTIFAEEIKCRCDGLPLAAKTLAEVLAKTAWEAGSLATGSATSKFKKKMEFEINVHDRVSLSKAWYRVLGIPGVEVENTTYYKNHFQVTGTCPLDNIALELGRFCHVELISFDM